MAMSEAPSRPLDAVTSIKVKLGLLVAVSVAAAALLGAVGSAAGVPPWLSVPVAVALALGLTQLLAAGMIQPLREMTRVAQQMAGGDYSGRVRTAATDEVGQLARAFNQMAEDLALVDAERRELVATVSHELRTPVTALSAVLENLVDGVVPADSESLAGALAQAERLAVLVQDLLDLSRLEAGVTRLDAVEVGVGALVAECAAEVRAAGRTAVVDVRIDEDLVVRADPARLRQLLTNVLDNAARHSPDGAPVQVLGGREGASWWLTVSDSGPGVDPGDRERVFDRFGTDAEGGGTGLGLAVARWVAQLHGGNLRFVDPESGRGGARLRLTLPLVVPEPQAVPEPVATAAPVPVPVPAAPLPMPVPDASAAPAPAAPVPAGNGSLDHLFGSFWPETGLASGRPVVLASAGVGVVASTILAFSWPGLSFSLVLLLAGGVAFATAKHRRRWFTLVCSALSALLVLPLMLLDAFWISALCALAAALVFLVGVVSARTVPGFVLAWIGWPLSSLRGLPWFGRSLTTGRGGRRALAIVRTVVLSLLGVLIFGSLFASADELFASWVDAILPTFSLGESVVRAFVAVGVFGLTLAGAYLALNPPRVPDGKGAWLPPLANRFEWLAPVLLIDAVFAVFLAAQATVVFGGHEYLERTTGITYADYVHEGFGQLTVATMLTLFVVWAAARRAGDTPADRWWLRLSVGLLCGFTLVVVASALYRMHVYQQAYGFTRLRLLVDVFEGWLGLLVLMVIVAGLGAGGRWLARAGVISGAVALLALAAINPDAWIAERNLQRYADSGRLDASYLRSLSADAVPEIVSTLPEGAACLVPEPSEAPEGVWSWNLGRARAERAREGLATAEPGSCQQWWALDRGRSER